MVWPIIRELPWLSGRFILRTRHPLVNEWRGVVSFGKNCRPPAAGVDFGRGRTRKRWGGVLAKTAMHQCSIPVPCHPPARTSPATCPRVGQHARVCQGTAGKKKGGSVVRGTQESDRIALSTLVQIEVCSRALLPRGSCPEHQARGPLPQPRTAATAEGNNLVPATQETLPRCRTH